MAEARLAVESAILAMMVVASIVIVPILFLRTRAVATPDLVSSMNNTIAQLSERITVLEQQRRRDHETLMGALADVETWKGYARQLVAILIEQRVDVPPAPDAAAPSANGGGGVAVATTDRVLYQAIGKLFSVDEIDDLAFQLGIAVEDLEGGTVGRRSRSLVSYARRHGIVEELTALVRRMRPESEV